MIREHTLIFIAGSVLRACWIRRDVHEYRFVATEAKKEIVVPLCLCGEYTRAQIIHRARVRT